MNNKNKDVLPLLQYQINLVSESHFWEAIFNNKKSNNIKKKVR